jgi:hypothetical protein
VSDLVKGSFGKEEDLGLGLPEKKNYIKSTGPVKGQISRFVFLIAFPAILCIQINFVSAASNEAILGEGSASIMEFFSDQNISDATVRFEKAFDNISIVFTLRSENRVLKS